MKKHIIAAALVLCMCLSLTACSKKAGNLFTGYKKGDVTLGQYKGVKYKPVSIDVTEEEIDAKVDELLENNSETVEVEGRDTVQNGDIITFDYKGFIDGVAFDRGEDTDAELEIGSGSFIPGFEDEMIGKKIEETTDIKVTFPDPYKPNPDLSGKDATFTVTVHKISEKKLPELTDAFVYEKTQLETVQDYRNYLRINLTNEKIQTAEDRKYSDVIGAIVDSSTFNADFSAKVAEEAKEILAQYNQTCMSQFGASAEEVFGYIYGLDSAGFAEFINSQAETDVKCNYIFSAVAEAENIEATDEYIEKVTNDMLSSTAYQSVDEYYAFLKQRFNHDGKEVFLDQVKLIMAIDFILDSAVAE